MVACIHCGKDVHIDSAGIVRGEDKDNSMNQYCWMDPVKGSQTHDVSQLNKILIAYAKERGCFMTVEELICSHRNLIKELNEHHRKKSLKEIKALQDKVINMQMDATWIKIEKLKTMTLQEIADLIGTST